MQQLYAGLVRGIILAALTTGGTISAALLQMPPLPGRSLVAIGLGAFCTGLISRLLESGWDAKRASDGRIVSSDIAHDLLQNIDPKRLK